MPNEEDYGPSFYEIFTHRAPAEGDPKLLELQRLIPILQPGLGRTASNQAFSQAAAVFSTIAMSAAGGTLTGFILKLPYLTSPSDDFCFDELFFEVPPNYDSPPQVNNTVTTEDSAV